MNLKKLFNKGGIIKVDDINKPIMEHIKEKCGNKMYVNMNAFSKQIPYHALYYYSEKIETKGKIIKRIYCDICATYWDKEYKKVKNGKG